MRVPSLLPDDEIDVDIWGWGRKGGMNLARNTHKTCTITPIENLEPDTQPPFILILVPYQQFLLNPQPTTHNPQPTTHNSQLTSHKPKFTTDTSHLPSPNKSSTNLSKSSKTITTKYAWTPFIPSNQSPLRPLLV